MRFATTLTGLGLVAILAGPLVTADAAGPPTPRTGKKARATAAVKHPDARLVHELRAIYKVLDRADPIYKGHRDRAKHDVNLAIGDLEKEMHRHGLKAHPHRHKGEAEDASNHQIRHAHRALHRVQTQLARLPQTPLRQKAAGHLKAAEAQLDAALAVIKNGSK